MNSRLKYNQFSSSVEVTLSGNYSSFDRVKHFNDLLFINSMSSAPLLPEINWIFRPRVFVNEIRFYLSGKAQEFTCNLLSIPVARSAKNPLTEKIAKYFPDRKCMILFPFTDEQRSKSARTELKHTAKILF